MPLHCSLPPRRFNPLSPASAAGVWWKVITAIPVLLSFHNFCMDMSSANIPFRNLGILITFCSQLWGFRWNFEKPWKVPFNILLTLKTHHGAFRITLSLHQGFLQTTQWETEKLWLLAESRVWAAEIRLLKDSNHRVLQLLHNHFRPTLMLNTFQKTEHSLGGYGKTKV